MPLPGPHAAQAFWRHLPSAVLDAAFVLHLAEETRLFGQANGLQDLYVRQSYVRLAPQLLPPQREPGAGTGNTDAGGLTVLGNPGIGKSTFLGYLAWLACKRSPRVPVIYHFAVTLAHDPCFALLPDGTVTDDVAEHLQNPQAIYLVDNCAPLFCLGRTILVTSVDNQSATKLWFKQPGTDLWPFYMPVWSWVRCICT